MFQPTQLQFKLMTPEAQRTAIQRLALCGADLASISERSGLSIADVRRHLTGAPLQAMAPPWARMRPQKSGQPARHSAG
jgi:hypothetical protein